jgi:acylaminoacyl-peptidase
VEVTSGDAFLHYSDPTAPLIVNLHGGPHGVWSDSWLVPVAFLLAAGFNVLEVNYCGSGGFGREFIETLAGHVGEYDVRDIWAAIDAAAAHVSTDRLFALGGSYGGYLCLHLC